MTAHLTLSNSQFDRLSLAEQEAATSPSQEASLRAFAFGPAEDGAVDNPDEGFSAATASDDASADEVSAAEVSPAERDRRLAAGLPATFDDDDDDLGEDLRPAGEKRPEARTEREAERDEAEGDVAEGDADGAADPVVVAADADTSSENAVEKIAEKPADAEAETGDELRPADDPLRAALVERAVSYGLEVERFRDDAALEASVAAMDRLFHDIGAAELEAAAAADSALAAPAAGPARRPDADSLAATPGKGTAGAGAGGEESGGDSSADPRSRPPIGGPQGTKPGEAHSGELAKLDRLKRDEYSPELFEALDEMRSVIAELRAEHQTERAQRMAAAEEASEREIDSFFAEIAQDNPVWSETFGTAAAAELLRTADGRKLFENRMNVLRARDNYAAGLESRRRPTPDSRKLLESGLALAFREKLAEAAERKLARKLQGRHAGAPPRPTQRQTPRRDPGSALREALRRYGMESDDS